MNITKLNESYSIIDADFSTLQKINDYLKVERPGAWFERAVQAGFKSPYENFAKIVDKKLLIMNGHLELLQGFGVKPEIKKSEFTPEMINQFLASIKIPFEPYDFQIKAFTESLLNVKQINRMCTGSGKSLTISLIAEFFRQQGKKGILLVPNINLLTQFKNDIKDYNLIDLYEDTHVIGGGSSDKHFDKSLTISTWQSMANWHDKLDELDYVMCDETHRFASEETAAIVKNTINCEYKWGFTGTIPDDDVQKMTLIGLFGLPKTYITARELIDRGLATPIHINSIIFKYERNDLNIFKECKGIHKQLTFIKEHEKRNDFIVDLSCKLRNHGNSLLLFQHTLHGKELFINIMNKLYPDVEVKNKDITGKKSFEFQEKYRVYFLNGEDNSATREKTRKILEEHDDAILVSNYALLSTGVNIKKLHNMIMASPLKSYTTISQSIGRLMRLHPDKKFANVYDLVDDTGVRKPSGPFYKQYEHRKALSYNPEEFPIKEIFYNLN